MKLSGRALLTLGVGGYGQQVVKHPGESPSHRRICRRVKVDPKLDGASLHLPPGSVRHAAGQISRDHLGEHAQGRVYTLCTGLSVTTFCTQSHALQSTLFSLARTGKGHSVFSTQK